MQLHAILPEDALDGDLAAMQLKLEQLTPAKAAPQDKQRL